MLGEGISRSTNQSVSQPVSQRYILLEVLWVTLIPPHQYFLIGAVEVYEAGLWSTLCENMQIFMIPNMQYYVVLYMMLIISIDYSIETAYVVNPLLYNYLCQEKQT